MKSKLSDMDLRVKAEVEKAKEEVKDGNLDILRIRDVQIADMTDTISNLKKEIKLRA